MRGKKSNQIVVFVAFVVLSVGTAKAGGYLDKKSVEAIVSGNTAEMNLAGKKQSVYIAKGHYRTIKFFSDGRIEQRTARGKGGTTTESGSWRVENDGRLCINPTKDREKCRALKSVGGNRYELYNDKGQRKSTWSKIVPGT